MAPEMLPKSFETFGVVNITIVQVNDVIDFIPKWPSFKYSFVFIQISP